MNLNSRERMDRCFKHLETDRPGIFVRGVGETSPKDDSYIPLRKLVLEKCDLRPGFNPIRLTGGMEVESFVEPYNEDFCKITNTLHAPAGNIYNIHMKGLTGKPGYTRKYFIEDENDAEKFLSMGDDRVVFNAKEFFMMDDKLGDRGVVLCNLGENPAGNVSRMMGSELFAIWSIENRELLHALLEREARNLYMAAKQLIDADIGPYFGLMGQELIVPPLHGRKDFFDFNVRYDKAVIDLIHDSGGFIHIHSHGSLKSVIDGFVEIGTDVLHPVEAPPMGDITPKEAKTALGEKVCIEGNLQIAHMYESTGDDIRQQVLTLIEDTFYDRKGLILCPTASPYIPKMSSQALENYSMLINTVLKYK